MNLSSGNPVLATTSEEIAELTKPSGLDADAGRSWGDQLNLLNLLLQSSTSLFTAEWVASHKLDPHHRGSHRVRVTVACTSALNPWRDIDFLTQGVTMGGCHVQEGGYNRYLSYGLGTCV